MWNRKRRIKCGEEKPQCLRCISEGYTCDSYDGGTSAAPDRRCESSFSGPEFEAYQRSCGLRIITANIDGTDIEKWYFHDFRNVAAQDSVFERDCQLTRFFSRMCAQISHQEGAVKHAMVALGSAYHLLQQQGLATSSLVSENLELFTIRQYTKALSQLQTLASLGQSASRPASHHTLLLLVCCISFSCLEILRANRIVSYMHLVSGLNIIGGLPPHTFRFLNDLSAAARRTRGVAETELEDIISIFGKFETFGCFFVPGFQPVIGPKGYDLRRSYDGSDMIAVQTLDEAHLHACHYFRDIISRLYETSFPTNEILSQPKEQQQHRALATRAHNILALFGRLASSPDAPQPGSYEFFSMQLDLLHICCGNILLQWMDEVSTEASGLALPEQLQSAVVNTDVRQNLQIIATFLYESSANMPSRKLNFGFSYDPDIIGPLYYVATMSRNPTSRRAASDLLQDVDGNHGGYWDSAALKQLLSIAIKAIN